MSTIQSKIEIGLDNYLTNIIRVNTQCYWTEETAKTHCYKHWPTEKDWKTCCHSLQEV